MRALRRGRAALGLVRRELRADPRSGALVASLVALPSAAVMLVSIALASQTPTVEERLAAELGRTEARVSVGDTTGAPIIQSPDDPWSWDYSPETLEGDGMAEGLDLLGPADVEAALPDGAPYLRVSTAGPVVVEAGGSLARATVVEGEPWADALAGPYEVLSGRAPTTASEAMVSPGLAETLDLATGDAITVTDSARTVTVVGTMRWRGSDAAEAVFAPLGATGVDPSSATHAWYLVGSPVGWDTVRGLNDTGLVVESRAEILASGLAVPAGEQDSAGAALIATGAVGVLAVMLLAGAGFAVTFRAQLRERALVAVTGATRGSLVAMGAARGFWLGLAGGAAGATLGVVLGVSWVAFLRHWDGATDPATVWGYHVIWWHTLAVVGYGALAGTAASLLPALSASRIDPVAVLRGSQRPPRVRRWPGVVGAVLVAAAIAVLAVAATTLNLGLDARGAEARAAATRGWWLASLGAMAGFAGATLLTAPAFRAIARVAGALGVSARIAARDAARHTGRTVPVVAAVALVAALGGATLLTLDRDQAAVESQWLPDVPIGDALVQVTTSDADPAPLARPAADAVRATLPDADVTIVDGWAQADQLADPSATVPYVLVPIARVCPDFVGEPGVMSARELATDPRCDGLAHEVGPWIGAAAVGDARLLETLIHETPSSEARAALDSGGAVVLAPTMLDGDTLTVGMFDPSAAIYADLGVEPESRIVLDAAYQPSAYRAGGTLVVLSPAAAARVGWPVVPSRLIVDAPDPITPAQQAAFDGAITRATGELPYSSVESGGASLALSPAVAWATVGIVALFTLGCTAVALGLARTDARRDDFTLASLGASPGLSRAVAAWQGALIVGVAGAIGLALALRWVTVDTRSWVDVSFSPPWALLVATLLGAPVAAGALAWTVTRPPTPLHYRLAA
ncbi:ABC transporter permease [Demequina iriomotensis]|uniref:ABC transporter permease n=1 Tax=Demequina iriomotensis TaxID=1536641 RepID=UPI000783E29D|nr:ABC transporter permease [Demequina iriomotensis]